MSSSSKASKATLGSSLQNLSSEAFIDEPRPSALAKATIFSAAVAVIFFWLWAATTPVYEVVTGEGIVKPEGFVVELEHIEGGRISNLYVSEGQIVLQGDPILSLDDTHLQAELEKNTARANHLVAQLNQFNRILSHHFDHSSTENSTLNFSIEFSPKIQFQVAQIEHLRATREVDFAELETFNNQFENLVKEREILAKQTNRTKRLMSDGRATLKSYEEAQIQSLKLDEQIGELSGQISMQTAVIGQSRARERELITGFVAEADQEAAEIKAELSYTNQVIKQVAQRLKNTMIRATHEGVINNLGAHHAQEILAPGATVAEIVPRDKDVFAEIEVSADKIGDIREGSKAKLKIATHDYTRFGDIDAEVVSISPNSFESEDGSTYFNVSLKFDRDALNSKLPERTSEHLRLITPGMTVSADIRTGKKTVLAYLVKPLRAISDRAFSES